MFTPSSSSLLRWYFEKLNKINQYRIYWKHTRDSIQISVSQKRKWSWFPEHDTHHHHHHQQRCGTFSKWDEMLVIMCISIVFIHISCELFSFFFRWIKIRIRQQRKFHFIYLFSHSCRLIILRTLCNGYHHQEIERHKIIIITHIHTQKQNKSEVQRIFTTTRYFLCMFNENDNEKKIV